MDETGVLFELNNKETLTVGDETQIGVVSDGKEKKRLTTVLTVGYCPYRSTQYVSKIPPILIIKIAKPRRCTEPRPGLDIYPDPTVKSLAARHNRLVLQSYTG